MQEIYLIGESIISALGNNLSQNMQQIAQGLGGVRLQNNPNISSSALPMATINWELLFPVFQKLELDEKYTDFEKLMILSAHQSISFSGIDAKSNKTIFVISTTKGNIDLLDSLKADKSEEDRIHLWASAKVICDYFSNENEAVIISNACVSGVMATHFASELLRNQDYDQAVVLGGDVLSKFVVSGFQSFQSLSAEACKPYDIQRNGLNIGEAAGCLVLSKTKKSPSRL